jgi:hypothetical protein
MKAPVFSFVICWIGIFPFAAVLYVLKGGVDDREIGYSHGPFYRFGKSRYRVSTGDQDHITSTLVNFLSERVINTIITCMLSTYIKHLRMTNSQSFPLCFLAS